MSMLIALTLHEVYVGEIAMHDGQRSIRKIERRGGIVNSLAKRRSMFMRNRTMGRQVPEGGCVRVCVWMLCASTSLCLR